MANVPPVPSQGCPGEGSRAGMFEFAITCIKEWPRQRKTMFLGKLRRGGRPDPMWAPSFTLQSVLSYCHASCLPSEIGGRAEAGEPRKMLGKEREIRAFACCLERGAALERQSIREQVERSLPEVWLFSCSQCSFQSRAFGRRLSEKPPWRGFLIGKLVSG